mgnify:CR=1 FL=1
MPFQSEKQRRYLWANEPEIARDWTDTYGSRIQKNNGGITRLAYLHGGVTNPDGRRGFFEGAQREARAHKGAMSPGTGTTGRGRGLGDAKENAIRQNTIPTTHTTAPGTLSDPEEKKDYFTQRHTGSGWFGGGNKYGYNDVYMSGPKQGQTKPGWGGRILGGLGSMITGIPFIGGALGSMYDYGKGIFGLNPIDMSSYRTLGLYDERMKQKAFYDDALLSDNYSDMKIRDTSFLPTTSVDEEAVEAYNNYYSTTPDDPISFEEFVEVTGRQ